MFFRCLGQVTDSLWPLERNSVFAKRLQGRRKAFLERHHSYLTSYLTILRVIFVFLSVLLFSLGDCWLVQCHSGCTLPLSQNNLPSSLRAWGENLTRHEAVCANTLWESIFPLAPEPGAQTAACWLGNASCHRAFSRERGRLLVCLSLLLILWFGGSSFKIHKAGIGVSGTVDRLCVMALGKNESAKQMQLCTKQIETLVERP